MATEELPDDLDKLKITPKSEQVKLRDRNPFYNTNNTLDAANIAEDATPSSYCIARRKSNNNNNEDNIKQNNSEDDNIETVDPLRCLPGVRKLQLRKNSVALSKKNLLREPILQVFSDNLYTKCTFSGHDGRMIPLNPDETDVYKTRNNVRTKSSINNTCSFRDLIGECNAVLNSKCTKGNSVDNSSHSSKSFTIWQKDITESGNSAGHSRERQLPNAMLTCSQEASHSSNNLSDTRNCDDVTIVELASYFDTMVHIPKKMSSMAEMMYI